ncbi:hypothetical protein FANTH_11691 [Fusarium anthophilum]|uniref:Uncharacterized protein n=1 Tax=Fusarium anthophilum TaxID=48485 RepID=A0A8H4YWA1_9HYPO|nr:hypothetical protein FANTH_11691 [Fusarium anthophilum]
MQFNAAALVALVAATAVEARVATALLVCNAGVGTLPATAANGAALFTKVCINIYKCEHSLAPTLENNAYTGACTNCPDWRPIPALGGCAFIPQ